MEFLKNLKSKIKYKKAFTLAEVLITLSVLGVLVSLTIPTLINSLGDQPNRRAWQQAYSNASQAWAAVVAEKPNVYTARGGWGCTWPTGETLDYSISSGKVDAFKSKLNVVKTCINQDGCWPTSYEYAVVTGSGLAINFSWVTADGMCWGTPWHGEDDSHVLVDTNCGDGPNLTGKDIFSMLLGSDGAVYFAIGDKSTTGKPVSNGGICPYAAAPATINGRSVDFTVGLVNY